MKIKRYKKKDGKTYYKFNIYINGKITSRNGFKSKTDAQIEYVKLKERAEDINNFNFKFEEVYNMWLNDYKNTVKGSTLNKTKQLFKVHILPKFKDIYIKKITIDIMQEYINDLSKIIINYKVVKNYISNVFDYALKRKYMSKNPCKDLILPKKIDKLEKLNYFDKKELELFLNTAKEYELIWYTIFRLQAMTGMRIGEILALNWKDINFKNNTINISKTVTRDGNGNLTIGTPKTKKGTRTITLDKETLKLLSEYRQKQTKIDFTGIIFTNTKNSYITPSQPNRKIKTICNKAKLKVISTHGLRHTHCSILFESGANIGEVQKRLGHSDIKTTMNIYNHVSKQRDKEVVENLISYINF